MTAPMHPRSRSTRRAPAGDLLPWLERALRLPLSSSRILALTLPAPRVEVERLLIGSPFAPCLWDDGRGDACAATGVAATVQARGGPLIRGLGLLEQRVVHLHHGATDADVRVRCFGGLSFLPGERAETPDDLWHGFGDGEFILPEIVYGHTPRGAYLTFARLDVSDRRRRSDAVETVFATLERLRKPLPDPGSGPASRVRTVSPDLEDAEDRRWAEDVHHLCRRIRRGEFHKVVVSRRRRLRPSAVPTVAELLRRGRTRETDAPGDRAPEFRFAFGRGDRLFFGRTPERLVRRQGNRVLTEALAATASLEDPSAADALLADPKSRREQRLVVEAIRGDLAPFCESLVLDARPAARRLRDLVHLRTAIQGRLRPGVSALTLAAALHPTPAVGGLPKADALRFLRERGEDRGWYASPVGWVDLKGNGELAVALRCGLLRAGEHRPTELSTFAGAGIVDGSDPLRELEETRMKERSFLEAFGLEISEPGAELLSTPCERS